MAMSALFNELDKVISDGWEEIKSGRYWQHCMKNEVSVELYQQVMLQIYHYTRFNSINQAACAYSSKPEQITLLRFIYKHALEELGHENMVLRDLESIGALPEKIPAPLPPTQALISYLNDVALRKGPISRLGYSYWADDVYDHISPMLNKFREDLGINDQQMTFFVAHASIDEKHAEEVKVAIERVVTSEEDKEQLLQVAKVTLYLTGQLLEEAYKKHELTKQPKVTEAV